MAPRGVIGPSAKPTILLYSYKTKECTVRVRTPFLLRGRSSGTRSVPSPFPALFTSLRRETRLHCRSSRAGSEGQPDLSNSRCSMATCSAPACSVRRRTVWAETDTPKRIAISSRATSSSANVARGWIQCQAARSRWAWSNGSVASVVVGAFHDGEVSQSTTSSPARSAPCQNPRRTQAYTTSCGRKCQGV
jgi:hypothetical protein